MKLLARIKRTLSGGKKATVKKATKKATKKAKTPKKVTKPMRKAKPAKKSVKSAPKKAVHKKIAHKKTVHKKAVRKAAKKSARSIPKKTAKKTAKRFPKSKAKLKIRISKSRLKKSAKQKPQKPKAKKTPSKPTTKKGKRDAELAQALLANAEPVVEKRAIKPYPLLPGGQNDRLAMLVPLLRDLVRKGIISDWLINTQHNRGANVIVERNFTVEDELTSIREDVLLTIYERFPDGTIGEAQLPVISADAAIVRQQILEAKETCQYARKKAFTLPEPVEGIVLPQSYDDKMLQAGFSGNGLQTPREIYSQIKAIMTPITDVKTNCFEVLTSASTVRVMNSNGVDISYHKTAIYLEIVLSCKSKTEEREFVLTRIAVSPEQLDLQSLLLMQAQIVRDATSAQPNPGFTGDVMLAGQSVTEFFAPQHDLNPLVLHTSAKLETMNLSCLRLGQPVGHFVGEPVNISTNPSLPLGLFTMPVDEEGTALKPAELIRNGLFVGHLATARYAQYLDVPATGNISNIQVSPGATREQHLRGNNYFEIVSFSWFNPNPFSGDFSAEIRLGYRWQNGRKTALRGGTFTGNVFKNILNARFSKETTQSGQYYGPRAILFKQGVINKFE